MGLKNIPPILSPELLFTLASMGHGDEIVFADANFPTSSICRSGPKEIRADGHTIPELLKAVLQLLPLDTYDDAPVKVMDLVDDDKRKGMPEPPVWKIYETIIKNGEGRELKLDKLERFTFYQRAKQAFAVVHTGETAQYGNIILKKGVIVQPLNKE